MTAGNTTRELGGNAQFSSTWGLGLKLFPGPRFGIRLGFRLAKPLSVEIVV